MTPEEKQKAIEKVNKREPRARGGEVDTGMWWAGTFFLGVYFFGLWMQNDSAPYVLIMSILFYLAAKPRQ